MLEDWRAKESWERKRRRETSDRRPAMRRCLEYEDSSTYPGKNENELENESETANLAQKTSANSVRYKSRNHGISGETRKIIMLRKIKTDVASREPVIKPAKITAYRGNPFPRAKVGCRRRWRRRGVEPRPPSRRRTA